MKIIYGVEEEMARLHEGGYRDKVTRYHSYTAHPAETRVFRVSPHGE